MGNHWRHQPRDSRGRFASTKTPLWAVIAVIIIVGLYLTR